MVGSEVVTALSYPNPSRDGFARLYYEVTGSAAGYSAQDIAAPGARDSSARVRLRIYTRSNRLVWEMVLTGVTAGGNSYAWDGLDLKGSPLNNGLYFYTATVENSAGTISSKLSPLIILK